MSTQNLFSDASWLEVSNNKGYGPLPIPVPRDEEIDDLLRRWLRLASDDRVKAVHGLVDDQHQTLMAYAERAASRAVRERRREWVLLGLIAQGLSGGRGDWRENVLLLSLLYDACVKLGCSPEEVFTEAGRLLDPKVASYLREFVDRAPDDRSIEAMGYEESSDADGFRYERTR